ncbi:hypothetical protein [Aquimarina algicola]|uniref:Uncharacterized protein n=1 Tax=Aquimarina algicola TaxID=2589995 RepID=A0A504JR66_9FLAO|nr:hypothetical protein [Aquimarina algicola]TPN88840.1 hypothetical protein FHK87_01100 [Aquimarina algicola]
MEIVKITGQTKLNEERITRPVGALMLTCSQPFASLTNESITAYIERSNGNNHKIFTDIPLKALIALTLNGDVTVQQNDASFEAIIDLNIGHSIPLNGDESLKFSLKGLKAAVEYKINTIDYPSIARNTVRVERNVMNADERSRLINVENSHVCVIEGVDKIDEMNVKYENGRTIKLEKPEIIALSRFLDSEKIIDRSDGSVQPEVEGLVSLSLIGAVELDVYSDGGDPITFYLKTFYNSVQ